jgi:hypothetical protein
MVEWIWKHIVGEPCSLYHLLNRKSSFSNPTASLYANILFLIFPFLRTIDDFNIYKKKGNFTNRPPKTPLKSDLKVVQIGIIWR